MMWLGTCLFYFWFETETIVLASLLTWQVSKSTKQPYCRKYRIYFIANFQCNLMHLSITICVLYFIGQISTFMPNLLFAMNYKYPTPSSFFWPEMDFHALFSYSNEPLAEVSLSRSLAIYQVHTEEQVM